MPSASFTAAALTLISAKMVDASTVSAVFSYPINPGVGTFALTSGSEVRTVLQVGSGPAFGESYLYLNASLVTGFWTLTVTGVQAGSPPVTITPNPSTVYFYASVGAAIVPPFSGEALDAEQFLRREIPSSMKGSAWGALIKALAVGSEQPAWDNAPLIDRNAFLVTATDSYLDRRAAGVGVERPAGVGMSDETFREMAIEMSAGQVTLNSFLKLLTVFYGLGGTHASVISGAPPYTLSDGWTLTVHFDSVDNVAVTFKVADFANISAATANEVAGAINRAFLMGGYRHLATVEYDPPLGADVIIIYTGTMGAKGSVKVDSGSAQSALGLSTTLARLTGQPRSAYVFPRSQEDVGVVLPAVAAVVARNLTSASYVTNYTDLNINNLYGYGVYGSQTFAPFTLSTPSSGTGPYLFDGDEDLSLTSKSTTTSQVLEEGHQYKLVSVADSSSFPDESGWLVFAYGYGWQVGPVPYLGAFGPTSIILDPSFNFTATVPSGASVRLLASNEPRKPTFNQQGHFWSTNSPAGRVAAGESVDEVAAAGFNVLKLVSYPSDKGLGNEGYPTQGAVALSDVVACYAADVDGEVKAAREASPTLRVIGGIES